MASPHDGGRNWQREGDGLTVGSHYRERRSAFDDDKERGWINREWQGAPCSQVAAGHPPTCTSGLATAAVLKAFDCAIVSWRPVLEGPAAPRFGCRLSKRRSGLLAGAAWCLAFATVDEQIVKLIGADEGTEMMGAERCALPVAPASHNLQQISEPRALNIVALVSPSWLRFRQDKCCF